MSIKAVPVASLGAQQLRCHWPSVHWRGECATWPAAWQAQMQSVVQHQIAVKRPVAPVLLCSPERIPCTKHKQHQHKCSGKRCLHRRCQSMTGLRGSCTVVLASSKAAAAINGFFNLRTDVTELCQPDHRQHGASHVRHRGAMKAAMNKPHDVKLSMVHVSIFVKSACCHDQACTTVTLAWLSCYVVWDMESRIGCAGVQEGLPEQAAGHRGHRAGLADTQAASLQTQSS